MNEKSFSFFFVVICVYLMCVRLVNQSALPSISATAALASLVASSEADTSENIWLKKLLRLASAVFAHAQNSSKFRKPSPSTSYFLTSLAASELDTSFSRRAVRAS